MVNYTLLCVEGRQVDWCNGVWCSSLIHKNIFICYVRVIKTWDKLFKWGVKGRLSGPISINRLESWGHVMFSCCFGKKLPFCSYAPSFVLYCFAELWYNEIVYLTLKNVILV